MTDLNPGDIEAETDGTRDLIAVRMIHGPCVLLALDDVVEALRKSGENGVARGHDMSPDTWAVLPIAIGALQGLSRSKRTGAKITHWEIARTVIETVDVVRRFHRSLPAPRTERLMPTRPSRWWYLRKALRWQP